MHVIYIACSICGYPLHVFLHSECEMQEGCCFWGSWLPELPGYRQCLLKKCALLLFCHQGWADNDFSIFHCYRVTCKLRCSEQLPLTPWKPCPLGYSTKGRQYFQQSVSINSLRVQSEANTDNFYVQTKLAISFCFTASKIMPILF